MGRYDSRKGPGLRGETDLDASPGSTAYLGSHFISLGLSFFTYKVALQCLPPRVPERELTTYRSPTPVLASRLAHGGSQRRGTRMRFLLLGSSCLCAEVIHNHGFGGRSPRAPCHV